MPYLHNILIMEQNDLKLNSLIERANSGDMVAQYELAWHYLSTDESKNAVGYFAKSAEQGYALAQNDLGFCYKKGIGVERSDERAVELYSAAAGQGLAKAQNNLGFCYLIGEGVERSYERAVGWFEKAVEQGNEMAAFNLGKCYFEGLGVEKSVDEAKKWWTFGAERSDPQCIEALKSLEG